jgi:predicted small lipoprotein YifL
VCAAAVYATAWPDQDPGAVILPDRQEKALLNTAPDRRSFLNLAVVVTLSGFGAACGVKGPLYFPDAAEIEKKRKKDKDKDKTSQRESVPVNATLS